MAQSVEHVIGNDEVIGSIPITSSKPEHNVFGFFLFIKKPPILGGFFYFVVRLIPSSNKTKIKTVITA